MCERERERVCVIEGVCVIERDVRPPGARPIARSPHLPPDRPSNSNVYMDDLWCEDRLETHSMSAAASASRGV